VVSVVQGHIEAPNWAPDGKTLIYNGGGRLYRISAAGGNAELIDTGFAIRCNIDHGISPDGALIVVSDQSQPPGQSIIYTLRQYLSLIYVILILQTLQWQPLIWVAQKGQMPIRAF